MRLFVGFDTPALIKDNAEKVNTELRKIQQCRYKTVNPENMHITIEFIGDFPERDLPLLTSGLSEINADGCLINCTGIGVFPLGSSSPEVIWIGAAHNRNMNLLYSAVNRTLGKLRINSDPKPYHPHLTIGRLKAEPSPEFMTSIEEHRSTVFGSFTSEAFHLYQSEPGLKGSVYSIIDTYKLNQPAE